MSALLVWYQIGEDYSEPAPSGGERETTVLLKYEAVPSAGDDAERFKVVNGRFNFDNYLFQNDISGFVAFLQVLEKFRNKAKNAVDQNKIEELKQPQKQDNRYSGDQRVSTYLKEVGEEILKETLDYLSRVFNKSDVKLKNRSVDNSRGFKNVIFKNCISIEFKDFLPLQVKLKDIAVESNKEQKVINNTVKSFRAYKILKTGPKTTADYDEIFKLIEMSDDFKEVAGAGDPSVWVLVKDVKESIIQFLRKNLTIENANWYFNKISPTAPFARNFLCDIFETKEDVDYDFVKRLVRADGPASVYYLNLALEVLGKAKAKRWTEAYYRDIDFTKVVDEQLLRQLLNHSNKNIAAKARYLLISLHPELEQTLTPIRMVKKQKPKGKHNYSTNVDDALEWYLDEHSDAFSEERAEELSGYTEEEHWSSNVSVFYGPDNIQVFPTDPIYQDLVTITEAYNEHLAEEKENERERDGAINLSQIKRGKIMTDYKKIISSRARQQFRTFDSFILSLPVSSFYKKAELFEDWSELPRNALVFVNKIHTRKEIEKREEQMTDEQMELYLLSHKYQFRAFDNHKNLMFGLDSMDLDKIWEAINDLKQKEMKYSEGISYFYDMGGKIVNVTGQFQKTEEEVDIKRKHNDETGANLSSQPINESEEDIEEPVKK